MGCNTSSQHQYKLTYFDNCLYICDPNKNKTKFIDFIKQDQIMISNFKEKYISELTNKIDVHFKLIGVQNACLKMQDELSTLLQCVRKYESATFEVQSNTCEDMVIVFNNFIQDHIKFVNGMRIFNMT